MKKINSLLIGLPLMILSLTSYPSYAQEIESSGIEEIIVTARQQDESLQDVPFQCLLQIQTQIHLMGRLL